MRNKDVEKILKKKLGEKIAAARYQKNLSLLELANILEVDNKSIWRYEAGEQCPSALRLFDIAKALEINIEDLDPNPETFGE